MRARGRRPLFEPRLNLGGRGHTSRRWRKMAYKWTTSTSLISMRLARHDRRAGVRTLRLVPLIGTPWRRFAPFTACGDSVRTNGRPRSLPRPIVRSCVVPKRSRHRGRFSIATCVWRPGVRRANEDESNSAHSVLLAVFLTGRSGVSEANGRTKCSYTVHDPC